jgi:hypothetical protein
LRFAAAEYGGMSGVSMLFAAVALCVILLTAAYFTVALARHGRNAPPVLYPDGSKNEHAAVPV